MKFTVNVLDVGANILKGKIKVQLPLIVTDENGSESIHDIIIDIQEEAKYKEANVEIVDVIYDKNSELLLFRIEMMLIEPNKDFTYKTFQPAVNIDSIL